MNRNRDDDLLSKLDKAAQGHVAVNGDVSGNIFQQSINELRRLYEIEELAQNLFRPLIDNDEPYGSVGLRPTTAKSAEHRLKTGYDLGIAIGQFKPKDTKK